MDERLEGIQWKLDRAEKHLDEIEARGLAWVTVEETWGFRSQVNERERRYIVLIWLAEPPPPVLALMVDEVIHHLRSALDHLACYLVEWSGGQVGRSAWPIVRSEYQWERTIAQRRRRWQFWRKQRGGELAGATDEVRTFVQGKQPYKRPGKTRNDPLLSLNDLWNTEKHRVINAIHARLKPSGDMRELFVTIPDIDPSSFRWVINAKHELKLGAEQVLAVIEFPKSAPLPKVKVKGKIPADVLVGDGDGEGQTLREDLALVRSIVAEATSQFPPE